MLAQAGVVDSGGTGLVLLFDALCHVSTSDALPAPPSVDSIDVHVHEVADETTRRSPICATRSCTCSTLTTRRSHAFKDVWAGLGDSIVIVGGDGLYNCHIHTDDVGAAIEAALDAGRPREIRVTDLAEQVIEERWVREASAAPSNRRSRTRRPIPPRRPRSSRSWWARASGGSFARSACASSSSAASR